MLVTPSMYDLGINLIRELCFCRRDWQGESILGDPAANPRILRQQHQRIQYGGAKWIQ